MLVVPAGFLLTNLPAQKPVLVAAAIANSIAVLCFGKFTSNS